MNLRKSHYRCCFHNSNINKTKKIPCVRLSYCYVHVIYGSQAEDYISNLIKFLNDDSSKVLGVFLKSASEFQKASHTSSTMPFVNANCKFPHLLLKTC